MTTDPRSFFNALAPHWDANERLSTPAKIAEMAGLFDLRPGMSVLDLGTGTGVLLPELSRRLGPQGCITAVDFAEAMLARAREKFSALNTPVDFVLADFEADPIAGRYDRILLYCVYPHLADPDSTLRRLAANNLRPGGSLIIAFPAGAETINAIHARRGTSAPQLPSPGQLARRHGGSVVADTPGAYIVKITRQESTLPQ